MSSLAKFLFIAMLLPLRVVANGQSRTLDLSGFALGDSLSATKSKLTGYSLRMLPQKDPNMSTLVAYRPPKIVTYSSDDSWAFVAVNDKIAYIIHDLHYSDLSTSPLQKTTQDGLMQKFGSGSQPTTVDGFITVYEYDPSGSVSARYQQQRSPYHAGPMRVGGLLPDLRNATLIVPIQFASTCGKAVAWMMNSSGTHAVSDLQIIVMDSAPLFQESKHMNDAAKASEAEAARKPDSRRTQAPY